MPYVKNDPPWQPGGAPGISAERLNHMETQYDEAAADLNAHKSATPLDHPDGSVTAAKLASNAVTEAKIADGAVTANKIASGAVTAAKLASSAVTAGKLADGAVDTLARIASGVRTSAGGTEPNRIAVTDGDGAVGLAHEAKTWLGVQWMVPGSTILASVDNVPAHNRTSWTTVAYFQPRNPGRFRITGTLRGSGTYQRTVYVRFVIPVQSSNHHTQTHTSHSALVLGSFSTDSHSPQAFTFDMTNHIIAAGGVLAIQSRTSENVTTVHVESLRLRGVPGDPPTWAAVGGPIDVV